MLAADVFPEAFPQLVEGARLGRGIEERCPDLLGADSAGPPHDVGPIRRVPFERRAGPQAEPLPDL
jgi:hypothetical protein